MKVEEPEPIDNILHSFEVDDVENALHEAFNDIYISTEPANEANEYAVDSKDDSINSDTLVEQPSFESVTPSILPISIPCSVGSLPTPCAPKLDDLWTPSVSETSFESLTPFNDEQLAEYYQNKILFKLQENIEEFNQSELKNVHTCENHYLYILLQDYLHARLKLQNTKLEINESKYAYATHEKHIWALEPATYTQYGECQVNIIQDNFILK